MARRQSAERLTVEGVQRAGWRKERTPSNSANVSGKQRKFVTQEDAERDRASVIVGKGNHSSYDAVQQYTSNKYQPAVFSIARPKILQLSSLPIVRLPLDLPKFLCDVSLEILAKLKYGFFKCFAFCSAKIPYI
eukprot:IDg15495t1